MSETLTGNSNISHYRIISKLGAGGMGEVYLAEDSRLRRKIALKVLPENIAKNKDRLRRFEQEAFAASALNHPNIVTIYEISELNGTRCFIAMEFVEGSNVHHLIKERKLKLDETLDIAIQTASALAAAHAVGIVHRDIKPENIMRRPDGLIKVLDFGLAKQTFALTEPNQVDSEAVTREEIKTTPGLIMGTMPYMSPEQIRGNRVDARADIWSLGIVLYEMITGHLPFNGETSSDLLAAILKTSPPLLSFHKPNIPIELEHIVKKALGKDCDERYQVIKDFLLDLKTFRREMDLVIKVSDSGSIFSVGASAEVNTKVQEPAKTENLATKPYWRQAIPAFILLPAIFLGYYGWRQTQETKTEEPVLLASSQVTSWKSGLGAGDSSRARFSPDGKLVAFVASKDSSRGIWLKQIGGGEPFTFKQDDSLETSPLFSPDGGQIAYISERRGRRDVWLTPTLGGTPTLLMPLDARSRLIYWSKDGAIIYFEMRQNLYMLNANSKHITQLTNFDAAQAINRNFSFSPDEERISYSDRKDGQKDLWIADKHGNDPVRITNDVADDVFPIWHADGERIIYSSNRNGIRQISVAYSDGRPPVQLTFSDSDSDVADVSSDGKKILYQTTKDDSDIWGVHLDSGKEFQLTSDIGVELWQDAAPNGETIAYQTTPSASGGSKLFNCSLSSQKISGNNQLLQLASDGFAPRWSPDGNQLAFLRFANGNINIWLVSATGGDARALTSGGIVFGGYSRLPFDRHQTQDYQWSSDGRSLIYCAKRSDVNNVWQTTVVGAGEMQLTNNDDKNLQFFNPILSPDGSRVAWTALNAQKKSSWSIWISENGQMRQIYQSGSVLGIVGWSQAESELIIKSAEGTNAELILPAEINLFALALDNSAPRPIAKFKTAYFRNVRLSPDRRTLAFVTRQDSKDSIQIVPLNNGGTGKTLKSSNDARVYFSSLAWSPDSRSIYFSKQANWQVISIIDNFK